MLTFNPLGGFDQNAPLNSDVIALARAYRDTLVTSYAVPAGRLHRIYGHWTVGHYGQDFPDYNGAVRFDGQHFHLDVVGDPRDNAIGVNDNQPHAHTYKRNTGAFGIATNDMVFANEHDFGPEPLTLQTLEALCAGIAAVAAAYDIDIAGAATDGPYSDEPNFLTHAEAANRPGDPTQYEPYGPPPPGTSERWDLASFVPLPMGMVVTDEMATICGDALRHRAHLYKVAL